jgi:GNAT superfamily N-acetyltransferase
VTNTFFLPSSRWYEYGDWLKNLDQETLTSYFGLVTKNLVIDSLIDKMILSKEHHYLLIAAKDGQWVGITHIAINNKDVEFGLIVTPNHRQRGIASLMLDECINWARNRNFDFLFMHCVNQNIAIKQLCEKYQLIPKNMMGDAEVKFKLPPPNIHTFIKEALFRQMKFYHLITN